MTDTELDYFRQEVRDFMENQKRINEEIIMNLVENKGRINVEILKDAIKKDRKRRVEK